MTSTSHQTRDRLLALVKLYERQLGRLKDQVEHGEPNPEIAERLDSLLTRSANLSEQVRNWDEVDVAVRTAVEDLGAAVETVDADLVAILATEPLPYQEAVDRRQTSLMRSGSGNRNRRP